MLGLYEMSDFLYKKMGGNILLFLIALLLFIGSFSCTSGSSTANKPTSPEQTENENSPTETASPTPPRVLEAKWYEDSDGNGIPNFIEIELGYDPAKDECDPSVKCGLGTDGEDFSDKPQNTLLILDASGSMRTLAGGKNKIEVAKDALIKYISNASPKVSFGLLVYGHKGDNSAKGKAASCTGIDLFAPLGGIDKTNVETMMAKFEPTGWTPIGASLIKAREAFVGTKSAENKILLVSDGIETCGGDPVSEAKKLREEGFKVTIDVIGFGVSGSDAAELKKIAEAGGGTYTDAKTREDLIDYVAKQNEAFLKNLKDSHCYVLAYAESVTCDSEFVYAAIKKINEIMFEKKMYAYEAPKAPRQELEDLIKRIRKLQDERQEKRKEIYRKGEELIRRAAEIRDQTQDNYNRKKN